MERWKEDGENRLWQRDREPSINKTKEAKAVALSGAFAQQCKDRVK
jgi:hypothetical protein